MRASTKGNNGHRILGKVPISLFHRITVDISDDGKWCCVDVGVLELLSYGPTTPTDLASAPENCPEGLISILSGFCIARQPMGLIDPTDRENKIEDARSV